MTPPGLAAVATVRVEGPAAAGMIQQRFRSPPGPHPLSFPPGRLRFGWWRNDRGSEEEVVVCRCGEHAFEVNCHGGVAASAAIVASLLAAGATPETADDWLQRHVPDPIQRAAWHALSQAATPRAAAILLDQYRGALRTAVETCLAGLPASGASSSPAALQRSRDIVRRLLELAPVGLHLAASWRIVLAGRPNVGKSSLINVLLGYERAIVFDQPGTTRDVLKATTALDGWPCEFSDTAGLRETVSALEAAGMARARTQLQAADLVVAIHDVTDANPDWDFPPTNRPRIRVANKCDLPAAAEIPAGVLPTSARTGTGLDTLMRKIVEQLVPSPPLPGEAVPFTAAQVERLVELQQAMHRGQWDEAIRGGQGVLASGVEHPGNLPYTPSNFDDDRRSTDWQ